MNKIYRKKDKTGNKKRWLSLFMIMCLLGTAAPGYVHAENSANVTPQKINLGVSALKPVGGKWNTGDNTVYFGEYHNTAMKYRVLPADKVLLDCDTVLGNAVYEEATKLEGIAFTDAEDAAIPSGVTLLTAEQANNLYEETARKKSGSSNWWWLQTSGESIYADCICDGVEDSLYKDTEYVGVSPALEMNPDQILFATEKGLDKKSSLAAVTDSEAKEWKLTLRDEQMLVENEKVTRQDVNGSDVITVSYRCSNSATQVSVMITDKEYNTEGVSILYYGELAKVTDSHTVGKATFTLPNDYQDSHCVYIVAETVNEGTASDYASTPCKITIPAKEESKPTVSVDVSWTSMDFTYTPGTWNATNHTYGEGAWSGAENGGQVTMANKGNVGVTATVTFAPNSDDSKVTGSFDRKDPISIATNKSETVKLTLSGALEKNQTSESTAIGTITVSIAAQK